MASSSSSKKVFSGAELTKGGFAKAPDHLRNVIVLLHEAGLNYVLEEPCRVLNVEVEQFFDNARMDKQQRKLRSKVNGIKIKMTSLFLNKFLRMPTDDAEESITGEDTDRALAWCDYQGIKASALKKNAMNEEARFLADIIGKVFLCKPGSHDHISGNMFELMTAVVLRKKRNWGADLFRFIAGSMSKPSFGRIISLFICQSHPNNFSMSKGLPLHHHKKISMLTLERVKRKVPHDWRKAPKEKPADEQVPADNERLGEQEAEQLDEVSPMDIDTDGNDEPHVPSQEKEPGIPHDTSQISEDLLAQSEGEANGQLLISIAKMLQDLKRHIILEDKKMIDEVVAASNNRLSEFEDSIKITLKKFGDNLDHLNTLVFKGADTSVLVPEEEDPRVEADRELQEVVERMQAQKAKAVMLEEVPSQKPCDVQDTVLILDEPAGTSTTAVEIGSLVKRVKTRVDRKLASIYSP